MKKAAEYHQHAKECRKLAAGMSNPDHRASLLQMAETWEILAAERAVRVAREATKG